MAVAEKFGFTRSKAAHLIDLGFVSVNGKTAAKCSFDVKESDEILVNEEYGSSLGGLKLKRAFDTFSLSVSDEVCIDIGASNGGFTDVLLQNGAKTVYAVDVGECAFSDELKSDSRVVVMDRTNARFLEKKIFPVLPSFGVVDVSFISLTLILPALCNVLTDDGRIVALIKPQFECEKKDLSKKGILLDAKKRMGAVKKVTEFASGLGLWTEGVCEAPHPFAEKNIEYLAYFKKISGCYRDILA